MSTQLSGNLFPSAPTSFLPVATSSDSSLGLAATINHCESLVDCGRFLDALSAARSMMGPQPELWPGLQGQRLAIRLTSRLGGEQRSRVLRYRFIKQFAGSAEAMYYRLQARIEQQPLARVWLEYRDTQLDSDDPKLQAAWSILKAKILEHFRDFERAHQYIDDAERRYPQNSFFAISRAGVWLASDDNEQALKHCLAVQEAFPQCSLTASVIASIYTQSNRVEEAIELLKRYLPKAQYGAVATQLVSLYQQRQEFALANEVMADIERFYPLADPLRMGQPKPRSIQASLAAMRSELAYMLDDSQSCINEARKSKQPFLVRLADHLENFSGEAKRKEIKVPFQKQAHMTCAPATLSMLAGYWNSDVDHDAIAAQICFEGTSAVDQRLWAESQGFVAKEFRCTEAAAQSLLDRDIPFAVTTVEAESAHIQVICGYDTRRGALLVQDPGNWYLGECQSQNFLDAYAWSGPRALVLVPKLSADRLKDLELPECEQYDWLFRLELALRENSPAIASAMLERFQAWDADHRLTRWAEWIVAGYEQNSSARLEALTHLSQQYPDVEALILRRADGLAVLGRADESRALLREAIESHKVGLACTVRLLCQLSDDCMSETEDLLDKILTWAPTHEVGLLYEASRLQREQKFEAAFELLRLAALAAPQNELIVARLLEASERFGLQAQVLSGLEKRFREFGHLNADPGLHYARALASTLQFQEAARTLQTAIELRPHDGSLVCQAAELIGRWNGPTAGLALLDHTQALLPEHNEWRTRAVLLEMDGRLEEALAAYRRLPTLGVDECELAECIASLTTRVEGLPATVRYLKDLAQRHPRNVRMLVLAAVWLNHINQPAEAIEYLDRGLAIDSTNAWAWRERAISNQALQRYEAALVDAERSLEYDRSFYSFQIRADMLAKLKRFEEARSDYRSAVELCVDSTHAIHSWMGACENDAQRLQALSCILEQLAKQSINGEGLVAFYNEGRCLLSAIDMEQSLRCICKRWPNLLRSLTLLSEFLTDNRRNAEAVACLTAAQSRFERLPEYWRELGCALHEAGQLPEAISALQRGFNIDPGCVELAELLIRSFLNQERVEEARAVIARAMTINPTDARLWLLNARIAETPEEAASMGKQAVLYAPAWDAAWDFLQELQTAIQGDICVQTARELIQAFPLSPIAHARLGQALAEPDQIHESLQSTRRAIELDPTCAAAHRLLALRLSQQGYLDAALSACQPQEVTPLEALDLRCYAAELLYDADRKPEALQWLYRALENHASQPGRWVRLADMAEELNDKSMYAIAVDALLQQMPNNEVALGYYHLKHMHSGQFDLAEQCLREALRLKPSYAYGLRRLFMLLKAADRFDEAALLLRDSQPHIEPVMHWELEFLLAVSRGNAEQLDRLLALADHKRAEYIDAIHNVHVGCEEEDCKWLSAVATTRLDECTASPLLGQAWALASMQSQGPAESLLQLAALDYSESWSTAAAHLCFQLQNIEWDKLPEDQANFLKALISGFVEQRCRDLAKDSGSWSQAIWAVCGIDDIKTGYLLAKRFHAVPGPSSSELHAGLAAALMKVDLKLSAAMIAWGNKTNENYANGFKALAAVHFGYVGDFESMTRLLMATDREALSESYHPVLEMLTFALEALDTGDTRALDLHWRARFGDKAADHERLLRDRLHWHIARRHRRYGRLLQLCIAMLR